MEADGVSCFQLQAVNLQYKFPLSFILLRLRKDYSTGTYACTVADLSPGKICYYDNYLFINNN